MTDDETREAGYVTPTADKDSVRAKWLSNNREALEEAARTHKSWARALEADSRLAERLRILAEMPEPSIARSVEAYETLSKLAPDVRGSLDSLLSRIGPLDRSSLPPETERALENALGGLARLSPRFDDALLELNDGSLRQLASALPDLRRIQRSLNELNQPAATRQTQDFLTGTDSLRYRGKRRVWHYTNAHALDQILKQSVLWASSPHHLNDASELVHGVKIVKDAVQRAAASGMDPRLLRVLQDVTDDSFIGDAMHEIFFISASLADDSLTLWRNYAAADGFAIGMKPGKPLSAEGLLLSDLDTPANPNLPTVANWFRVHYKRSTKAGLADSFVASAIRDIRAAAPRDHALVVQELRKHLIVLASTMKHESFADEREVRWITTNWAPLGVVHYEVTGRGFVPVLHVRSSQSGEEQSHLPITGLRCSPTTSPTIERTMSGLLSQRQYAAAAADVRKSALPYRG